MHWPGNPLGAQRPYYAVAHLTERGWLVTETKQDVPSTFKHSNLARTDPPWWYQLGCHLGTCTAGR
jgi:hypothetical protein